MSPTPDQPVSGSPWRQLKRFVRSKAPLAVWLGAIGVCLVISSRIHRTGPIMGYAEHRTETIYSPDARRVASVRVSLHEYVPKGHILAQLDDAPERTALDAAQIEIRRLRAEVNAASVAATADHARDETDEKDAERRFIADLAGARMTLVERRAELEVDRVRLASAQRQLDLLISAGGATVAPTPEAGGITPIERETLEATIRELTAAVEQHRILLTASETEVTAADSRLQEFLARRAEAGGAAWSFDPILTPLRLAVEVQEKNLEALAFNVDRLTLRAPADAQVTQISVTSGSTVPPGAPLLTLVTATTDRIIAYVPESQAGAIALGGRVQLDGLSPLISGGITTPQRYEGFITTIADEIAEVPARSRSVPNIPQWARAIVITLPEHAQVLPGEAFHVRLVD